MIVTEKESAEKNCPMAMANSRDAIDKCRASGCMAWRWHDPIQGQGYENERRGFCGLAGKPVA